MLPRVGHGRRMGPDRLTPANSPPRDRFASMIFEKSISERLRRSTL